MSAKNYTRKELLTVGGTWVAACGYDVGDADKPFRSSKKEADAVVYRNLKKALSEWIENGQLAKEDGTAIYLAALPEEVQNFLTAEKICTAEDVKNDSEENDGGDDEEDEDDELEEDDDTTADEDEEELDDDEEIEDDEDADDADDEDGEDEEDEEEDDLDDKLAELEEELDDEEDEEEAPAPKRGRGRPAKSEAAPARALKDTAIDAKTQALKDEQKPVKASSAPVTVANAEAAVASICKMLEAGKVVVITALSIAEANAHFSGEKSAVAAPAEKPARVARVAKETPVEAGAVKRGRGRPKKSAVAEAPAAVEPSNELSAADARKLKAVEKKAGNEIDALLLADLKPRAKRLAYCIAKKVKLPSDAGSWDAVTTRQLADHIHAHHVSRTVRMAHRELLAG